MAKHSRIYAMEWSAWLTVVGVILLFASAIIITLLAPRHVDSTWTQPTSPYQVQMYEVSDPNVYLSSSHSGGRTLQYVDHIQQGYTLSAFVESDAFRIIAPPHLEKYVTRSNDATLKLTSRPLLLRPSDEAIPIEGYDPHALVQQQQKSTQGAIRVERTVYELFDPEKEEAFAIGYHDGIFGNWVDADFALLDEEWKLPYQTSLGVVYVKNPIEFRVLPYKEGEKEGWRYNPRGKPIENLEQLRSSSLGFRSRKELIEHGEHTYAIEGCWYCHTDQTRTLVQDVVLNGGAAYPAPPSSPNEFIYQRITFPGTRRIGPDLSRVAIKRPHRDWHMSHFWAPRVESPGSVMPSFQHFFDNDPRGIARAHGIGIPNYPFEALYQYLMTKGSRITPPNEAWWEGKDPIDTIAIIEGKKRFARG